MFYKSSAYDLYDGILWYMTRNGIISAVFIIFALILLGNALLAVAGTQQTNNNSSQQVSSTITPTPIQSGTTGGAVTNQPSQIQHSVIRGQDDDRREDVRPDDD